MIQFEFNCRKLLSCASRFLFLKLRSSGIMLAPGGARRNLGLCVPSNDKACETGDNRHKRVTVSRVTHASVEQQINYTFRQRPDVQLISLRPRRRLSKTDDFELTTTKIRDSKLISNWFNQLSIVAVSHFLALILPT